MRAYPVAEGQVCDHLIVFALRLKAQAVVADEFRLRACRRGVFPRDADGLVRDVHARERSRFRQLSPLDQQRPAAAAGVKHARAFL